ncbi:hypothetical protein ACJMK2_020274 [Sinanodonta woodiana]|uniref:Tetraspanin n=1 Tax=Sinanodonta woodiana TaxID=1069815 RepID=A0ABD3U1Y4_SINWO
MGFSQGFAKFILIVFNAIFLLSGIAILGVGIWLKVDKNIVNMQKLIQFDSKDPYLDNAAWVLIGFGVFVLLVGGFGFFAAVTQNKFFLVMYIGSLVIIFLGELGGGITAAVFKSQVEDGMETILSNTFKKYNNSSLVATAWDFIQVWLTCCGAKGYLDYPANNVSLAKNYTVPISCCVLSNNDPEDPKPKNETICESDAKKNNTRNDYLKKKGCYDSFRDKIKSHLGMIIGVAIGIAMIQLLGVFLGCCLFKKSGDVDVM